MIRYDYYQPYCNSLTLDFYTEALSFHRAVCLMPGHMPSILSPACKKILKSVCVRCVCARVCGRARVCARVCVCVRVRAGR